MKSCYLFFAKSLLNQQKSLCLYKLKKMQEYYQLKFFQSLLWIDPNKNISNQLGVLSSYYRDQLEFSFNVEDWKRGYNHQQNGKCLVFCSSKLIEQVYKNVLCLKEFYPKMFIFCGYQQRAKDIMQKNHYRQAIHGAYWEQTQIIDNITKLEEMLLKNPALMNNRVQIAPEVPKVQPPKHKANQVIPQKKVEQSSNVQKKIIPKKQEIKKKQQKASKETKQSKKEKKEKKQQKKAVQKKQVKKMKLKQDVVIYWAVADAQQSKNVQQLYVNHLKQVGIQIRVQQIETLRIQLQQVVKRCILISLSKNDLTDLTSRINNYECAIKISEENDNNQGYDFGEQNTFIFHSVEEIIEKLKNNGSLLVE